MLLPIVLMAPERIMSAMIVFLKEALMSDIGYELLC